MEKVDYKKTLKHLYAPSKKAISEVEVPPMNFLMIDGQGFGQAYQEAIETLYPMAYGLKFMSKIELQQDFTVMPLEGLWWAEDMDAFISKTNRKDEWLWTLMIMQPEQITAEMVERTRESVAKKKNPPALDQLRFACYDEGLSVQIMYLGAYADEGPTIAKLHQYIADNGYSLGGKHHEIYIGDPRRTAPEKLKTVIRQPMNAKV